MIYLKLFCTAVFWGGTFIAGRMIAGSVDPFSAAFLRFLIASVFLVFLTIKIEGRLPRLNITDAGVIILLGLTGIFTYNIAFFSGLRHIQANQASLIIACNPIFISLFSSLIFKERLSPYKIAGICLSVCGALIVISKGNLLDIFHLGLGKGELLIFCCVASWVAYSLLGKTIMNRLSPIASVCYSSIAGTLFLFFPVFFRGSLVRLFSYEFTDWASLFYLGFFGTVIGFLWYYEGIKKIGPMKAGIFINFVPISAIMMSYLILKESITPSLVIGALFVIGGVRLTNTKN